MICPHCTQSITYKERNYNVCSKCHKEFAFEPKTHSLQLSDAYFSNVVKKLSNNDKLFFTPQQLQFSLSRKKIKNSLSIYWLFIPASITIIIASFIYFPIAIVLALFWFILIAALQIRSQKIISLPQDFSSFDYDVLNRWKAIYGKYPDKLIRNNSPPSDFNFDLKGVLLCEESETAMCLLTNHATKNLAVITNPNQLSELLQKHGALPIYVLHNASSAGYQFVEKIKQQFSKQTQIFDIGLRPQAVMKTNLMKFRETGSSTHFNSLKADENKWLKDGYYTPLFTLRPEKLIQYVTKQLESRAKFVVADKAEEKAKAIGFMTWAGEK